MNQKIAVTLTPEEALRLGLMRPVAEQEIMKPIGKAFMDYAETQNFGYTSFIMEEFTMKIDTAYISVVCPDFETAVSKKKLIAATYHPDNMFILGNELLIPVPENQSMHFSLNQLKNLVTPGARVDMFNYELDTDGQPARFWYCS